MPNTSPVPHEAATSTDKPKLVNKFKEDMIQLLLIQPAHSLTMANLPEEYQRHFGRPYLLSDYGAKRTIHLLSELTSIIKVHTHTHTHMLKYLYTCTYTIQRVYITHNFLCTPTQHTVLSLV